MSEISLVQALREKVEPYVDTTVKIAVQLNEKIKNKSAKDSEALRKGFQDIVGQAPKALSWLSVARLWQDLPVDVRKLSHEEKIEYLKKHDPRRAAELLKLLNQEVDLVSKAQGLEGAARNRKLGEAKLFVGRTEPELDLPGTAKTGNKLAEHLRRNPDVKIYNFGLGQNDSPVYAEVVDAVVAEAKTGYAKYSAAIGHLQHREQIARYYALTQGYHVAVDEILVGPGGKDVITAAIESAIPRGSDALVAGPHWPFQNTLNALGRRPVTVAGDPVEAYRITADDLEAAIKDSLSEGRHVGAFIFTNPVNPTGAVYTREELLELTEVLNRYDVLCIADQFYDQIVYNRAEFVSIATLPGMREHTLVIGGATKGFSLAGWRVGWVSGPRELLQKTQIYSIIAQGGTSNLDQVASYAALKTYNDAWEQGVNLSEPKNREFEARANLLADLLNSVGLKVYGKPKGAFYLFPDVGDFLGYSYETVVDGKKTTKVIRDDVDFADYLLSEYNVNTIPGSTLGKPGALRFSFGSISEDDILAGIKIIERALERLKESQRVSPEATEVVPVSEEFHI